MRDHLKRAAKADRQAGAIESQTPERGRRERAPTRDGVVVPLDRRPGSERPSGVDTRKQSPNRYATRLPGIEKQLCEDFYRSLKNVQPGHNLKAEALASLAGVAIARLNAQKVLAAIDDDDLAPFDLPPKARTPYSRHWKNPKFGKRLDVETFLIRVWHDLASQQLLLTEHLRRVDQPLCQAIAYQAETRGIPLDDFRLSLGILSIAQVLDPPSGLELPAALLRKVLAREQIASRDRRLGRE